MMTLQMFDALEEHLKKDLENAPEFKKQRFQAALVDLRRSRRNVEAAARLTATHLD